MNPIVKEFQDDVALKNEVKELSAKGISKDDLYVISHDVDRTERVAGKVDANTVGINEEGLGTAVGNIFRKKGDELREKFKELGFTQEKANELEAKLDHGEILLIVDNAESA
ncbi:general stress protein [Lentibacillus sp. N15]|uniref:general stress protein n=1 Tax=Lentibacillus songyuanensis TaxID=3136161 RepID=UPI0031BA4B41